MQANHYRAAICLNNYGASLLERGHHREASVILRDSLIVLNSVLQQNETCVASVADKLHFAHKCMAESHSTNRKRRKTPNELRVHVLRYSFTGSNFLADTMPETNLFYTIKIEDFGDAKIDELVRTDMDIHSAIIVYNTAMARFCGEKSVPPRQKSAIKVCIQLLQWSRTILSRSFKHRPQEATQLKILVLSSLIRVLQEAGQMMEAAEASRSYQSMKRALQIYEGIFPSHLCFAAAA